MTSGKVAVSTPIVFNRAERVIERKRIDGVLRGWSVAESS